MNGVAWWIKAAGLAALSVAACGCNRQSQVPFDPFIGSSRVPPPGTGSASGAPPYYQPGAAPAGTTVTPGTTLPVTPPPLPTQGAATSGTSNAQIASSAPAAPVAGASSNVVQASHTSEITANTAATAPSATAEKSVVRIVEPTQPPVTNTTTAGLTKQVSEQPASWNEPRPLAVDGQPKEITDLPQASDWTPVIGNGSATRSTAAAPVAAEGSYGHDPNYRWLQGRLEYSQVTQKYKLRYIPIDGQTDKYGGSVVLPSSPELQQFQHGQFVRVEGTMGAIDNPTTDFAPVYTATRIKLIAQ